LIVAAWRLFYTIDTGVVRVIALFEVVATCASCCMIASRGHPFRSSVPSAAQNRQAGSS